MDDQDKVFVAIAVRALRAVLGNAKTDQQRAQWTLALNRVTQTHVDVEADEEIAALRDKRNPEQVRHAAIDGVMRVISDLPADEQKKVLDYALMGVTTPSDANAFDAEAHATPRWEIRDPPWTYGGSEGTDLQVQSFPADAERIT